MTSLDKVRIVKSESVVMCEIEGGVALLDLDRNIYFSLNRTGATVWDTVQQPSSLEDLCAAVAQRFAVTQDGCKSDITRLVDQLLDKRLVRLVDAASG